MSLFIREASIPAPDGAEHLLLKTILFVLLASMTGMMAHAQPTVTLLNTARTASDFYVGDGFILTITGGAPNATVSVAWTHNGSGGGPGPFGTTDGSGTFQIAGIMDLASVGSWTQTWYVAGVQATPALVFVVAPGPSITLTNLTRPGDASFLVNDHLSVNITGGLPNASVTVAWTQNGANNGPAVFGTTDSSGSYVIADSTVTDIHIGAWTQTWYVAGMQAAPVLSFNVYPATCNGSISPLSAVYSQGQFASFTYSDFSIPASQRPTNVVFQINGTSANPYSNQVSGSHPNATDWAGSSNSGALGTYRATPVISYAGISVSISCQDKFSFFQIQDGLPGTLPSPGCTTLSGIWDSSSPGETFVWNISQSPGGPLSISDVADIGPCGTVHYTGSGSYSSSTRQFSLAATSPSPGFLPPCSVSTFENESGTIVNGLFCGYATGTWTTQFGSGSMTFVRRSQAATGEVTAFVDPNNPWADQYGSATLARYKATIQNTSHPEYNWAGNRVRESGSVSDGCLVSGDPFDPVKQVTGGTWFVQADQHYETDFVGYGPLVVAWLQTYQPQRLPCTLRAQQQMSMFPDNVPASSPQASQPVAYGPSNVIEFTVSQTGVTASRSGVSATRVFHF